MQQDPRKEKMRSFSRSDIRELAEHFGQFGSEQMIGIGNDLTPHYLARCPIIYIWSSLIIAILVVGLFRLKSLLVLMLLFKKHCIDIKSIADHMVPPITIETILSTEGFRKRNPTSQVGTAGRFQVEKIKIYH